MPKCAGCNADLVPRQYQGGCPKKWCSDACRVKAWKAARPQPSTWAPRCSVYFMDCRYCGAKFTARRTRTADVCKAIECRRARKREESAKFNADFLAREGISYKTARRRAGLVRDGFRLSALDRLAIYRRDDWVCQLCLEPVDPSLPGTDRWGATVDHIVCRSWTEEPDNSPENLRLAHMTCNASRGNREVA